jgi:hypothetical protein
LADFFLEAVRELHQQRAKVRAMTPERRAQMFARLDDDEAENWLLSARDEQLPPPDLGWCWLYLGAAEQEKPTPAAPPSTSRCAPASPASTQSPQPLPMFGTCSSRGRPG